jgi:SnoaL-like protein
MAIDRESRAVDIARRHVKAWSNHDWDTASERLSPELHVTTTTTKPGIPRVDTTGLDAYMDGLTLFAGAVTPGSMREIASIGDDHNALLMLTVEAAFVPDAPPVTLPAGRLYLIDDDYKIASEQVVFLIPD